MFEGTLLGPSQVKTKSKDSGCFSGFCNFNRFCTVFFAENSLPLPFVRIYPVKVRMQCISKDESGCCRKEVSDCTEGRKYLGRQMIGSMPRTVRALLEVNMNEMLCFID